MIIGIEGGIGSGKTLSMVNLGLEDLYKGKKIFTNVKLKKVKKYRDRITYLTKEKVTDIFHLVKSGEFNMENSTILIDEAHNYIDSRNSASSKNKIFSYWILQSRHTGKGSCDIIYTTQELRQIDVRLRNNTDWIIQPNIIGTQRRGKIKVPVLIRLDITAKIKHKWRKMISYIDVGISREMYDTHELIDF